MKKIFRFSLLLGAVAMMLSAVTMTSCGDDKDEPKPEAKLPHEVVDLGLPSGTKWAAYNVGATKPEEIGFYFAFGETKPKNSYTWATYLNGAMKTCDEVGSATDPLKAFAGKNIAGTKYDAATANWGAQYVMPTKAQYEELVDSKNTKCEGAKIGGVDGLKITSLKNGKSIFLPTTGYMCELGLEDADISAYWYANIREDGGAYYLWVSMGKTIDLDSYSLSGRSDGQPVRAVLK